MHREHLNKSDAKKKDRIFQVRPLDDRIGKISRWLWRLGRVTSIDEWVAGFQGPPPHPKT